MHEFRFRNNELYCESIQVSALAKRFGTPLFVYSYTTLLDHYMKLKKAFRAVKPLICYSVKANSNLGILKALVDKGAGLDIVSGGELYRALKSGCAPERIVYASVGKTEQEIEEAVQKGILFFNIESPSELETINQVSSRLGRITRVAIRINPDIEPKTHAYITTGKITNKFGIDLRSAYQIFLLRKALKHVVIAGLHIHIGSQITKSQPYVAAIKKIVHFIGNLKKEGIQLEYLNIGGGLGIIYDHEKPQTADSFAAKIIPLLRKTKLKIILEPGRFIAGNAGILVTKVLYVKRTPLKKFIIVDAGMNDLMRPSLYDAYHTVVPVRNTRNALHNTEKVDIVGPICESGDFLAKNRIAPTMKEGDYLAVMGAGAYGFSMSSNYNSRRRAEEIMVFKDKAFVIRKRENYADLIRNEIIPPFLSGL